MVQIGHDTQIPSQFILKEVIGPLYTQATYDPKIKILKWDFPADWKNVYTFKTSGEQVIMYGWVSNEDNDFSDTRTQQMGIWKQGADNTC